MGDKYENIFEEFSSLKENHKNLKNNLSSKLRDLKSDLDEWKNQEANTTIIHIDPHKVNYNRKQRSHSSSSNETKKSSSRILVSSSSTLSLEEKLIKLRKELPELHANDKVLVKFPHNGWYYHSTIKENMGDYKYKINASLNDSFQVYREDIIQTTQNNTNLNFQV